jgi:beta-hydroxylase
VDGQPYAWRDGEAFLFDETRLHFARNDSDQPRLILMCDVERPMSLAGRLINYAYKGLASLTVVPNLPGDRRGLANRVFAALMPALARSKALKQSHRRTYKLLKYTVNSLLALLITGSALGVIHLVRELLPSL